MGKGKYLTKCLEIIPYSLFLRLYPFFKRTKLSDFADYAFKNVFIKKSRILKHKEKYIEKIKNKGKYCYIEKGSWNYQLANFCFVKNMLSNIVWCVECGFLPIVNLFPPNKDNYIGNINLWELFFQQPLIANGIKHKKYKKCPIISSSIIPDFRDVRNKERVEFWNLLLELFAKYNNMTIEYFDSEYDKLIKGKSVIACVLRSTDYTKLKPSGHPIQPKIEDVFDKIRKVMIEYKVECIYLATEDKRISERFHEEFPNKIIENKRRYLNEQYDEKDLSLVSQVHFERKNDDYLKMLEYMSSINLVSKCDYLVTGLSGGSEMAIYRNGNRYVYSYIFDEGVY